MNDMSAEVVIVGAGPVGLTLAVELRLHGVRALVLERLAEPTGLSKALGLIGRSVDTLDRRGLLGWFRDRGAADMPGLVVTEPYPDDLDRDAPMALEELRAAIRRANGADVPVSSARWLSRFTDSSRLADSYRAGRVLLAGDAAHIHLPAGGPGLNTGLLDAFNLGWKLAAQVRGWAPPQLLDSYGTERRAEGERVLLHTRAQGALRRPRRSRHAGHRLKGSSPPVSAYSFPTLAS